VFSFLGSLFEAMVAPAAVFVADDWSLFRALCGFQVL
jgi:hypothetical protein